MNQKLLTNPHIIHSLVHLFNPTRVRLEADQDHLFGPVCAEFTPTLNTRTERRNELEFDSIESNKTGVNTQGGFELVYLSGGNFIVTRRVFRQFRKKAFTLVFQAIRKRNNSQKCNGKVFFLRIYRSRGVT